MDAMARVEAIVIGAGIVGLACGRALAKSGKEVLILDKAAQIGSETSSRNSEVVHGGLYYPPQSYKAQLCVRGRQLLYNFCDERSIRYNKCGKLIVATTHEHLHVNIPVLQRQAQSCGVSDTRLLTAEDVSTMEPELQCLGALWSPSTGIVDSHALMLSILADAEEHGAILALHAKVTNGRIDQGRVQIQVDDSMWLQSSFVINCAGLWADGVAALIHQNHEWHPPKQYFAKGTYFRLQGRSPFQRLIYPMPDVRGGLGVHATIDVNGQTKFGPDVEWLPLETRPEQIDWIPDEERCPLFYGAIRQYWPRIADRMLVADYTGVRPKLSHPSLSRDKVPFQDFAVLGSEVHGVEGLVHLMGIESPGLTSSLAIAEYVVESILSK